MKGIRGLHDINTHGTLSREGRLFSIAKNLHQTVKRAEFSGEESWVGSVKSFVPVKNTKRQKFSPVLFLLDPALKTKIRMAQIEQIQEFISEMEEMAREGVKGAVAEIQALKERLARWEEM